VSCSTQDGFPEKTPQANGVFTVEDLYFTDLPQQVEPAKLLVLVLNYNNGSNEADPREVEQLWSDLIFGTGTLEDGTASVNDYYREMSGDRFYFQPVLLDGNSTGVYSFSLDKDYSDEQGLHPEWPFFEFNYDMMGVFEGLVQRGLVLDDFVAPGVNQDNYSQVLIDYFDAAQWDRNSQWYATSKVLCIFPTYNFENVDWTPLSFGLDQFTLYAHINFDSSWGTIVHELAHTLGAIDVYQFGSYDSDLMSSYSSEKYGAAHINPFYKIIYGWTTPEVVTHSSVVTLYPSTSDQYQPAILTTADPDQYFIVEYRTGEGFDAPVGELGLEGVHVWRIDKLGCEAIYPNHDNPRKGISLEGILSSVGQSVSTRYYKDRKNLRITKETPGATVTYMAENSDGSVDVRIEF